MEFALKFIFFLLSLSGSQAWSYENQIKWRQEYPRCAGKQQSPIEINTSKTTLKTYSPLVFSNFNIQHNVTIRNNGKSVEIDFSHKNENRPCISGGPLKTDSKYRLENIHFHWGATDAVGSEHVINRKRFPMEVHAVHYNTKYSNFDEAVAYPDGIAVLAVFYYLNEQHQDSGINSITDVLPSVANLGARNTIIDFKVANVFNAMDSLHKHSFFTYKGSLTTPPCLEVVNWLILPKPIAMRASQLRAFRKVVLKNASATGNNWRHLQRKFGRKVYWGIS